MKIAHISDLHLGYTSGKKVHSTTRINLREQDGYDAFSECLDGIIEQKVDLVLCTGDFFHAPRPSMLTLRIAQEYLDRLVEAGIPFYNLAGNHDATDSVKDIPANRILHNPRLNLYSHTEPYIQYNIGEDIILHLVSHHGYISQKETMEKLKPIKGKFNILATHGSCYDTEINGILHTEASPREIVIPEDVLKLDWDYILLGHIHERGWVNSIDKLTDTSGRKTFYGGSIIRRGFSDKPCKLGRGWTLWTINQNKEMIPEFFTIHQRSQYDHLIFCQDKDVITIEKEIIQFFEGINLGEIPIARITLVDSDNKQKMKLDWKKISEYSKECLTFSVKIKTKEQIKKEITDTNFSFDLLKAFSEYWNKASENFNEHERDKIKNISDKLLKKGQEKVLS